MDGSIHRSREVDDMNRRTKIAFNILAALGMAAAVGAVMFAVLILALSQVRFG